MMSKIREAMRRSFRNNEKGFTLIELLVVVAILGILAAVVIPRISTSTDKAEAAADKANAKTVQSAVERYKLDNGNYPSATSYSDLKSTLVPTYINELPNAQAGSFSYSSGTVTYTPTT